MPLPVAVMLSSFVLVLCIFSVIQGTHPHVPSKYAFEDVASPSEAAEKTQDIIHSYEQAHHPLPRQSRNKTSAPRVPSEVRLIITHPNSGLERYLDWLATRCYITITRLSHNNHRKNVKRQRNAQCTRQPKVSIRVNVLSVSRVSEIGELSKSFPRGSIMYFTRKSFSALLEAARLFDGMTELPGSIYLEGLSLEYQSKLRTVFQEDLLFTGMNETKLALQKFARKLGVVVHDQVLDADAVHFRYQNSWWDRSDTFLSAHLAPPLFFRTLANRNREVSLADYLEANRRCAAEGIFPQLQLESEKRELPGHCGETSVSNPRECLSSDIFDYADRETLYRRARKHSPIKCGFARKSALDALTKTRMSRNESCRFVVATFLLGVGNDQLPTIQGAVPNGTCFVAFVMNHSRHNYSIPETEDSFQGIWQLEFLSPAMKHAYTSTRRMMVALRTLAPRLFPLAERGVWLNVSTTLVDMQSLVDSSSFGVLKGIRHPKASLKFTLADDVSFHLKKKRWRYENSTLLHQQLSRYEREGLSSRLLPLKFGALSGEATTFSSDPCALRFRCAWHNEQSYFTHVDSLSLLYAADRLRLMPFVGYDTVHLRRKSHHH